MRPSFFVWEVQQRKEVLGKGTFQLASPVPFDVFDEREQSQQLVRADFGPALAGVSDALLNSLTTQDGWRLLQFELRVQRSLSVDRAVDLDSSVLHAEAVAVKRQKSPE